MPTTSVYAAEIRVKQPGEELTLTANFTPLLQSGESLASVDAVEEQTSFGDLTLSGETVNGSEITPDDGGAAIAAGKAVQFTCTGGSVDADDNPQTYVIRVQCTTDLDDQVREVDCKLRIQE